MLVASADVGKLTCRADELFVKSIGHQWLRKAPSERKREEEMGAVEKESLSEQGGQK